MAQISTNPGKIQRDSLDKPVAKPTEDDAILPRSQDMPHPPLSARVVQVALAAQAVVVAVAVASAVASDKINIHEVRFPNRGSRSVTSFQKTTTNVRIQCYDRSPAYTAGICFLGSILSL